MLGAGALIRLYPRAWQQRYGAEMREMLSRDRLTLRAAADLVAGAIDARLYPQQTPVQSGTPAGVKTMTISKAFLCAPAGVTIQDQRRSAAWMIGASLGLTALGVLLRMQIGPNAFSESLLYSSFPAAVMLSSECTYLKRYSPAARVAISGGGAIFTLLIMWAAVVVGSAI